MKWSLQLHLCLVAIVLAMQVILESPVEDWPLCDVMLSWHSEGNASLCAILLPHMHDSVPFRQHITQNVSKEVSVVAHHPAQSSCCMSKRRIPIEEGPGIC